MIGKTLSHYRILEEIGSGGMGVVYRAEDLKLERTVALKFLVPRALESEEERHHFLREARACAALDHPNICTIYEINEIDGQTFMAMACIEGQSLKAIVQARPLDVDDALDFGLQVAEGLSEAHEKGIEHRDIKSANIMVTPRCQALITDFGLARMAEQTDQAVAGATAGTAAYMSPEQVRGEEIDHRTDIWSLGVVLYEMLTGELPFKGAYEQAVMYSILNESPVPFSGVNRAVPPELEKIVSRALEKDREKRYQQTADLLEDLRTVQETIRNIAAGKGTAKKRGWYASPASWIVVAVLLAVAVGSVLHFRPRTIPFAERDWVLITDLENTTGNEIFDGAVEEILERELSQSKYVNVIPAGRKYDALRLMRQSPDTKIDEDVGREIALRDGGIRAIIVCSIQQMGEKYAITCKVTDPGEGVALDSFVEEAGSVDQFLPAIQRLSDRTRRKLGESLEQMEGEGERPFDPMGQVTTARLEALKYYRQGITALVNWQLDQAVLLLQRAVEKDPEFAIAQNSLGAALRLMGNRDLAKQYFDRAFELAEGVSERERYFIRGNYFMFYQEAQKAVEELSMLVAMYPDHYLGNFDLGNAYMAGGAIEKGRHHLEEAVRVRPNFLFALGNLLRVHLMYFQDLENAREVHQRIIDIDPQCDQPFVQGFPPLDHWISGDLDAAEAGFLANVEQSGESDRVSVMGLIKIYVYMGEFDNALIWTEKMFQVLEESSLNDWMGLAVQEKAMIHLELGDISRFEESMNFLVDQIGGRSAAGAAGWLAFQRARTGEFEQVEKLLAALASSNLMDREKAAFTFLVEGELARARKDYPAAIDALTDAVGISPGLIFGLPPYSHRPIMAYESLALAYENNGELSAAIEIWEKILSLRIQCHLFFVTDTFGYIKAHYHLGRLYQKKGETEKSVEYFNKFIDFWKNADRKFPEIEDARARVVAE